MDFGLTEEQTMLQDSVRRFLTDRCPLDVVRAVVAGDDAALRGLEDGLAELGIGPVLVPESAGGLGLGLLDAALVQQTLGEAVCPAPFTGQALLATLVIQTAASAAQADEWLPALVRGEMRCAIAATELAGAREAAAIYAPADCLDGKALFALDAEHATHVLVADVARRWYLVDLAAGGVRLNRLQTIDVTRSTVEVLLDKAPATPLVGARNHHAAGQQVLSAGRVLLAADSFGAASAMLAKAVDYAQSREQFGRVIASFQAVKHLCAEMAARLEPCRALLWYAAYAGQQQQDDAELMALLAKSHIDEVARFVARTATEVHGGMGFTDLLGLHYWFKRIGANRQLLGGPERLREAAAQLQGFAA
ncbi:MAG: acyl-CoA dehydrogenase [Pseudomonadota bacterium]